MVYFATFHYELDGGIMVTASHNPPNYNGMKMVREGSRPISEDSGLRDIRRLAEAGDFENPPRSGSVESRDVMDDYIAHLLSYIEPGALQPL
jgi:phosphomannomutase/phosphomannomutase/phosphoglucomutase